MKGFIKFTVTLLTIVLFISTFPLRIVAADDSEIDESVILSRTNDPQAIFIDMTYSYFQDVSSFIKAYYNLYSMSNYTCTFKSSTYFSLDNLNQNSLNSYYHTSQGTYIKKTCTSVAITDLVLNYKPTMNKDTAFVNLVNQAQLEGYSTVLGQIYSDQMQNAITLCATQNSVSKTGAEFTFNKRARTRNALNSSKPVLLEFDDYNHDVVAKGIEIFTISYKNPATGRTKTQDVEFFIVNDGWGRVYGSLVLSALFSDSTGSAYVLQ